MTATIKPIPNLSKQTVREMEAKAAKRREQVKRLLELQSRLTNEEFYGSLEIRFKAGAVCCIRKVESIDIDGTA